MRLPRMLALLPVALALGIGSAHAAPSNDRQVDELTDAIVSLLPLGEVMEKAAAEDPTWPLQGKADAVSAEQLACLRRELSVEGFRRYKREEVARYAGEHGKRLADDTRLVKEVAPLFSKLVQAGIDAKQAGGDADAVALMRDASADQMLAMVTLARDPKYRDLRALTGLGESLGENKDDDHASGEMLAVKAMFHGFKSCDVSPGALM
jgi:hypothetical protein